MTIYESGTSTGCDRFFWLLDAAFAVVNLSVGNDIHALTPGEMKNQRLAHLRLFKERCVKHMLILLDSVFRSRRDRDGLFHVVIERAGTMKWHNHIIALALEDKLINTDLVEHVLQLAVRLIVRTNIDVFAIRLINRLVELFEDWGCRRHRLNARKFLDAILHCLEQPREQLERQIGSGQTGQR